MDESNDFCFRDFCNKDGKFQGVWFTYKKYSLKINDCCQMVMFDATYKTSLYRYPLINVIGFDGNGEFFKALVVSEKINHLKWFFTSFESIFTKFKPCVLIIDRDSSAIPFLKEFYSTSHVIFCQWHIENNVHSHFKKSFVQ